MTTLYGLIKENVKLPKELEVDIKSRSYAIIDPKIVKTKINKTLSDLEILITRHNKTKEEFLEEKAREERIFYFHNEERDKQYIEEINEIVDNLKVQTSKLLTILKPYLDLVMYAKRDTELIEKETKKEIPKSSFLKSLTYKRIVKRAEKTIDILKNIVGGPYIDNLEFIISYFKEEAKDI